MAQEERIQLLNSMLADLSEIGAVGCDIRRTLGRVEERAHQIFVTLAATRRSSAVAKAGLAHIKHRLRLD
jgi:hypothetical protein